MALWFTAQNSPCGIELTSSNPRIASARLNSIRRELDDPRLAGFVAKPSPLDPANKLWIMRTVSRKAALAVLEEDLDLTELEPK